LSSENKEQNLEYLANPLVGDVYEYRIEARSYSTMKVIRVTSDSVLVVPNEYETNKVSGLREINKEENYSDVNFNVARLRIKEMFNEGDIIDISRK
jgi:ribosomal protein L3